MPRFIEKMRATIAIMISCKPAKVSPIDKRYVLELRSRLKILNTPENVRRKPINPVTLSVIPGYKNRNLGLAVNRKIKCLHPSRQVRRCGALDLPSGLSVVGTSVIFSPLTDALTIISLANSIPVDFKFNSRIELVLKARRPQ